MVTYVRDTTGRFQQRPHYELVELDRECEAIVTTFLKSLHGEARFPVETEDLKKLIERDADDLDIYADLTRYGDGVEGVTEFRPGKRPKVFISGALTEDGRRENRLRTTLTHEYGHVHFHAYLWEMEPLTLDLLRQNPNRDKIICKRETMIEAAKTDWMEWQAGYICGALLMPKSVVTRLCREFVEASNICGAVSLQSGDGPNLVQAVVMAFRVSENAARVRLLKLGLLTPAPQTKSLFS